MLRHELTHAIPFQQMPLRRTFSLMREYLMDRHGADWFFAFRDAVLRDPEAYDAAFVRHFGAGFAAVAADFEQSVRAGDWPRA